MDQIVKVKTNTIFLGDIHGDFNWVKSILENNTNIRTIIQVGDFGFWEHTVVGQNFLDGMSALMEMFSCELFFVDGNHENHEMLVAYNDGRSYGDSAVEIRDHIYWLPRGCVLLLEDGRSMMAFGGATSVNKPWLKQGVSWWPGEEITTSDIEFALSDFETNGHVDILVSHDAPSHLTLREILGGKEPLPINRKLQEESTAHRGIIAQIFDASGARVLVHGHYHAKQTSLLPDGRKVFGLSQERTGGSFIFLHDVK